MELDSVLKRTRGCGDEEGGRLLGFARTLPFGRIFVACRTPTGLVVSCHFISLHIAPRPALRGGGFKSDLENKHLWNDLRLRLLQKKTLSSVS